METGHGDKVEWGEEQRKEETQPGTFARGERRAGGEGKGLGGSTDGEEEEEEEDGEEEEGNMSQMEGVHDFEERVQDFDNPFLTYNTPMDQMSAYSFHGNAQAAPGNSTDGEAKQVECGSEEGEIADDGQDQREGEVEKVRCSVLVVWVHVLVCDCVWVWVHVWVGEWVGVGGMLLLFSNVAFLAFLGVYHFCPLTQLLSYNMRNHTDFILSPTPCPTPSGRDSLSCC